MSSSTIGIRGVAALFCVMILLCGIISGCSSKGNSDQSQSTPSESAANSSPFGAAASTQQPSASSAPTQKDRNGFNAETNSTVKIGGVSFQLPSYYGEPQLQGESEVRYADNNTAILTTGTAKTPINTNQFDSEKHMMAERLLSGMSQAGYVFSDKQVNDTKLLEMPAVEYEASVKVAGQEGTLRGIFFLNEPAGAIGILSLLTSNAATFDYQPDYKRILDSASISQPNASSSAEAVGNDAVSPDLKETMDSYEAFMDEYIDFMKRYQETDDTMSLLQDYTDYMAKYSDFMQKVNKLDTSKMSAADSAYYLEVTTRVSKKLLEASL